MCLHYPQCNKTCYHIQCVKVVELPFKYIYCQKITFEYLRHDIVFGDKSQKGNDTDS